MHFLTFISEKLYIMFWGRLSHSRLDKLFEYLKVPLIKTNYEMTVLYFTYISRP